MMNRIFTVHKDERYQVQDDVLEILDLGHPSISPISRNELRVTVWARVINGKESREFTDDLLALVNYLNSEKATKLEAKEKAS